MANEKAIHPISEATRRWLLGLSVVMPLVVIGVWFANVRYTAWLQLTLVTASYAKPPDGMVFVPPGEFQKGSDDPGADDNERPARLVFLPGFYIDRTEVTNAEYQRFDPGHAFPPDRRDFPVVKCAKEDAERYATWAGKRLPTGDEWEKAARGSDGRLYPWGNSFDQTKANLGGSPDLVAVGSFAAGASPYGALDMAGNAWEWVSDTYNDAERLGMGVGATKRGIIRGGAYSYSAFQGRASHIGFESEDLTCGDLGFRCVKDAIPTSMAKGTYLTR